MRTVVITPPVAVVSAEEAIQRLRIEEDVDLPDIDMMIAAATAHIDGPNGWLGRAIGVQTLETRFDASEFGSCVRLPYPPVIDLVSIHWRDSVRALQPVDLTTVELFGDVVEGVGNSAWSAASGREAVRIQYRAGYEAVPESIRAAILLMVGDLYAFRETAVVGTISASIAMTTTVEHLLSPFRRFSV